MIIQDILAILNFSIMYRFSKNLNPCTTQEYIQIQE